MQEGSERECGFFFLSSGVSVSMVEVFQPFDNPFCRFSVLVWLLVLGIVIGGGDRRCHRCHLDGIMLRRGTGMMVMPGRTVAIVVVVSPLIVLCHQ